MQIERTLPDGRTKFMMEASTPAEAFSKLALIDDLFSETECGLCHCTNIKFCKRVIDNGFYLEMRCTACRAQLSYGQMKEGGGVFVKKWDKENRRPLPNGGWYIYGQGHDEHNQDAPPERIPARQMAPPPGGGAGIPF